MSGGSVCLLHWVKRLPVVIAANLRKSRRLEFCRLESGLRFILENLFFLIYQKLFFGSLFLSCVFCGGW